MAFINSDINCAQHRCQTTHLAYLYATFPCALLRSQTAEQPNVNTMHTNSYNTICKCFRQWCKYLTHVNYRLASICTELFSTLQGHKLCTRSIWWTLPDVCVCPHQSTAE